MYFKHPFILFALIFLSIPIIVHLFKRQQFTKIQFTNVKFLKNITLKNRKSSQLKKILILISRLLIFLFLILAFSQPYFSQNKSQVDSNLIVYLDNSYSLQAKQFNISMFETAIQDLLKFKSTIQNITLVTNQDIFKNLTLEQFRYQVSNLKFSPVPFEYRQALLRIKNILSSKNSKSRVFIISDFQKIKSDTATIILNMSTKYHLVQLQHRNIENLSLDSVFISEQNATNLTLNVIVKQNQNSDVKPAVSLFNNNLLIAKSVVEKFENQTAELKFTIKNPTNFIGKISLEDQSLYFDNSLYFVINKPSKINILSIGNPSKTLSKLYLDSDFNFSQNPLQNLDYTKIKSQQLIILNELEIIPPMLDIALTKFLKNGGSLVVIPDLKSNPAVYKMLFKSLNIISKIKYISEKQFITKINYGHPLLENVFEKQVRNFDYPSADSYLSLQSSNSSSIINFANGDNFISQLKSDNGNLYFVAAPFIPASNTFKNSPLIVPIFYNIAMQSISTNNLYYIINSTNSIKIEANLKTDDVLSLNNEGTSFIPLQHLKPNLVVLETKEQPEKPGFYKVINDDRVIQNLAFNLNRDESNLIYFTKTELTADKDNVNYFTDLKEALQTFKNNTSIFELWKICLAISLLFYLIEILLLKYFKK